MVLWVIIIVMLAATLAAILLPLYRGRDTIRTRDAYDANVYKDQLKAVERDFYEGLIEEHDAKAARVEISRNLIAASDKSKKQSEIKARDRQLSRQMAVILGVLVPVMALGLYLKVGQPKAEDQPLAARQSASSANDPHAKQDIQDLIARAEQNLKDNPKDGRGWQVMASVYLRRGKYQKSIGAYKNAIKLMGENGDRLAGLADAMIFDADGVITEKTVGVLEKAVKIDFDHPKPHFWLAHYHEQRGRLKEAEKGYISLLERSLQNAPFRPQVHKRLDHVRKKQGLPPIKIVGKPPQVKQKNVLANAAKAHEKKQTKAATAGSDKIKSPSADDIKRAQAMTPEERKHNINAMVDSLAEDLFENGGGFKRWQMLVNALMVMGKKDKAKEAIARARRNLGKDKNALSMLNQYAKKRGL